MATYCPNPSCGYKLKLTDWKPNCPKCGTNILYYKMEERLLEEADRVETANAAFQKKADRAKAAVIGSNWAIARLVLLVLPLVTLFFPLGRVEMRIPFVEKAENLNAISIVMALTRLDFDALMGALGNAALKGAFLWYALAIVGFALVILAILAGLVTCWLARSPGGFKRAVAFFVMGMGGTALGAASLLQFGTKLSPVMPGALTTGITWYGTGAVAFSFLLIFAVNIYIKATGDIPVAHKQCYISGFPEEEVYANLEKGITLEDMRRARDEAAAKEKEELVPA
ncbi:MAG: IBR domain-containing protein [Firmicutes bacterium]|nr:IBR domain-containing protein [Bacillota bacterium]